MKKISTVDWNTVAKLFAGGAITGAGVAAGTSFMRHLAALQADAKLNTDTSKDDDVLYIDLPAKKKAAAEGKDSAPTFALGGAAALTGAFLAYNLVRSKHQALRKKQLQKELDAAQHVYLGNPGDAKVASQFSNTTKLIGSGYFAALASLVGSSVIAYNILKKQFPGIKKPQRDTPRKVVIRTAASPEATAMPEPEVSKAASSQPSQDALEGLLRLHLGNKIASAESGFEDIVCALAKGRRDEMLRCIDDGGLDMLFSAVKGARFVKVAAVKREAAITLACIDPVLSSALAPILASEVYAQAPGFMHKAARIDARFHPDLIGLVESSVRASRWNTYASLMPDVFTKDVEITKSGSMQDLAVAYTGQGVLRNTIRELLKEETEDGAEPVDVEAKKPKISVGLSKSQDSAEVVDADDNDGLSPTVSSEDANAAEFAADNKGVIDKALARV